MSQIKNHSFFLDLPVLQENRLSIKPTNRYQFLSSNPYHNDKSFLYSQTLRLGRICAKRNDFVKYRREMTSWFL